MFSVLAPARRSAPWVSGRDARFRLRAGGEHHYGFKAYTRSPYGLASEHVSADDRRDVPTLMRWVCFRVSFIGHRSRHGST
eukprot:2932370-Prymnesium_polylepis.1